MSDTTSKLTTNIKKHWYWYAGGAIIAGFALYTYRGGSGGSVTTDTTATDTTGAGTDTVDYSGADQYGSDYGYSGAVYGGYYDPSTGGYISGPGVPQQVVTAPSTNAEWAQQAEAQLVNAGYNPVNVAAALGAYLIGRSLSQDQLRIIQAALALQGNPPNPPPAPHVHPPQGNGGHHGTQHRLNRLRLTYNRSNGQLTWTNDANAKVYHLHRLGDRNVIQTVAHGYYPKLPGVYYVQGSDGHNRFMDSLPSNHVVVSLKKKGK